MSIVPDFVLQYFQQHSQEVGHWISSYVYGRLVKQAQRHLLVRLQGRLDLVPLEAGCRGFHHQSGPGAKPTHGVAKLVRVLLVKYLYNWSLRQTEERLQHDLVLKWFAGYGVLEAVVDHSQLERFEQWVQQHQPRLFFDTILVQIEQALPEERWGTQIGDTFAMRANAAQESVVELLRHTSRCLLRELEQGTAELHQGMLAQMDGALLFGLPEEPLVYFLSPDEKQQQRVNTARGAWQLAQIARQELGSLQEPQRTRVQVRVEDLEKILRDTFCLEIDHGQVVAVVERPAQDKGSYRLCSATDREATARNHGATSTVGFNISLAATPRGFIRAITAATGAQPDQAGVAELLRQQRQHQGCCPDKLIYDRAAGAGRTRALVDQVSNGLTRLVAHIPPSSTPERFGPGDFQLLPGSTSLRCPAGRETHSSAYSPSEEGRLFFFSAHTCQDCPLTVQCRAPKAKPNTKRSVFLSDYLPYIRQAQIDNQSPAFRTDMRLRPRIERIILMLTRYDGARRARRRGIPWANFQSRMCATARNIRTWLQCLPDRSPLLQVS